MRNIALVLMVIVFGQLGGCGGLGFYGPGILVKNDIPGTVLKNLTVDGVDYIVELKEAEKEHGTKYFTPQLKYGEKAIRINLDWSPSYGGRRSVVLQWDVYSELLDEYKYVVNRRVYLPRNGYDDRRADDMPEPWNVDERDRD